MKNQWSSGRIVHCHGIDSGSILGLSLRMAEARNGQRDWWVRISCGTSSRTPAYNPSTAKSGKLPQRADYVG
ncbi:hypothetical protein V6N13_090634 [Hibiscus sabdariffa]